jgi:antitoxin (DNA-binding transcriptional repressor) of toxin-antitoxin stability system
MQQIALKEAEKKLAELIGLVAVGEDVIITKDDGSVFKIVLVSKKKPYPKFGSAKGLIDIADDFDEPLEDFEDYMP